MAPQNKKSSKSNKNKLIGPERSKDGIPYDYIVVVDAGSHGSRVYVYNWLNPKFALEAGLDLTKARKIKLVKRFFQEEAERSQAGSDSDSDSDDDTKEEYHKKSKVKFPSIHTGKKWHRSVKPGIASFNQSPQKVGKHHLSYLLNLASAVVPKSQHYRTPIFLHSTAGMRLLPPNEQEPILENVCQFLTSNSDFYMPDCASHVNVLDGNIEGLYGWLAINYLMGSFDRPEDHQHGKGHSTYGLLDMGGASTQVVFQPNKTEIEEHKNNLYKVSLNLLPTLLNSASASEKLKYEAPQSAESFVYSDSFLGFGMFQAHSRYVKFLLDDFRKVNDIPKDAYRFRTPIMDPCLPKGYTFTADIDDHNIDFTGGSDFQRCLNSIFPVLANSTFTSGTSEFNGDCQKLGEESKVSSCLLNDLIPSFDFDVNHFIGVSGYWDTINSLLESQSLPKHDPLTEKYDYSVIYKKTSELCMRPLNELLEINDIRDPKERIREEELAELCFKASWILNFLHVGLGFPRFGIDKIPNKDDKFKSLQLVEKVGGSSFSWTLGRAILYANDEYVQAFNNYTKELMLKNEPLPRPGYAFTAAEAAFVYGAEASQVAPRPQFAEREEGASYHYFDYETNYKDANESKWSIQPHRFYGQLIFITLIVVAVLLMIGRNRRTIFVSKIYEKFKHYREKMYSVFGRTPDGSYNPLSNEEAVEMSSVSIKTDENEDFFRIEEE